MSNEGTGRIFRSHPLWLTEGGIVERLRRGAELHLDPEVLHAAFVLTAEGRAALASLYQEYLDIAQNHDLPLLLFSPTWRANPERCRRAGFSSARELNDRGVWFLKDLLASRAPSTVPVLIGGLIGCRGDAYRPEEGLSRNEAARFHRPQAEALTEAGADFLFASTLPALPEALGMAVAMASTGIPWALSFLPNPDGCLLDGTPLEEAVSRAEEFAANPPMYLSANCIYPTGLERALEAVEARGVDLRGRLIGIQANGSTLSPEALDGLDHLESEPPEAFASAMLSLRREWRLSVLGGCCGTDGRHIAALAEGLVEFA